MQDERDELMKKTFPMLRRKAAERDVTLTELDLRWGITPEESESGKVVEICLREIENSVPFFIGIIGNRYGWIPSPGDLGESLRERYSQVDGYVGRRLSVTEMEMQFGVLERPEEMHAYFFIKAEETEDGDEPEKLAALKAAVRSNGRYPVSTYSSPEDLSLQVEDAFAKLLDELFPEGALSELEKERIGQRSYLNSLCQNYIRTESNFSVIDEWMEDWEKHQLVITGASGLGKSALVANWVKEKLVAGDNLPYKIIYHFVGNGGSLGSHGHIIKALCDEIRDRYSFETEDKDAKTDEKALEDLVNRVAAEGSKPLLIVLDAINQIIDVDNSKQLNWLPIPPKNVKILFTTLEDDQTMAVFKNRHYPVFTLRPLTKPQRAEMVKEYLHLYSKKLQPYQIERIITDEQCKNTLVLKTFLDELVNFGIFEKLDEKIESYLGSDSVEAFYGVLLRGYEDDFGEAFVKHILSLIAVSRNGLSEEEILSITKETPLHWSQFFCSIRQHLIVKKGLVSFAHSYLRKAVEGRYLCSEDQKLSFRRQILLYFQNNETLRAQDEVPFQLYACGDNQALHEWLMDLPHALYVINKEEDEFVRYWKPLYANGHTLLEYADLLCQSDSPRYFGDFISISVAGFSDYGSAMGLCDSFRRAKRWQNSQVNNETMEKVIVWEGIVHRSKSEYDQALQSFQEAKDLMRAHHDEDYVNLSYVYKHIGTIYNLKDDYESAKKWYLDALGIQQRAHLDAQTIDTLHSLGDNSMDAREYDDAKEYLESALHSAIDLLGTDNTTVSSLYNSIAALYDKTGLYEQSLELSLKSLDLDQHLLGENHLDIAHGYHNLAGTYLHLGRIDEAEVCYGKAISIKRLLFGDDNYETSLSEAALANVKLRQGKYQEALDYHLRYLRNYIKSIGTESQYLAVIYSGIGDDYYQMEDYASALDYHMKALSDISRKVESFPSGYYHRIGNDLYCLDRFQEAITYYERSMKRAHEANDEFGESVSHNCIGYSYGFLGEYELALEHFNLALSIRRRILPTGDERITDCETNVQKAKQAIERTRND
jgi:Tetratricopeptide repeat.